jgi:hypothetical protein
MHSKSLKNKHTPEAALLSPLQRGTNHNKMNVTLLILLLQIDIEEKMKNAPDSGYEIGVVIGTYLPFVLLIGLAYFFYYMAKKRKD